jgi:plastocyanin
MTKRKGARKEMNPANTFYAAGTSAKMWLVRGAIALAVVTIVITGIVLINREAVQQASAEPAESAQVALTIDGIDTPELQVRKNQSVVWENQDVAEHQLAMSSGTAATVGFGNDARLGTGQSYSYVFDTPGTYYYYDTLNPTLKGKITVTE